MRWSAFTWLGGALILVGAFAHAESADDPTASFEVRAHFELPIAAGETHVLAFPPGVVTLQVSTAKFVLPKIKNAPLSFGELSISTLTDTNTRNCGLFKMGRCSQAVIRMYTTGTAGPGLYNSAGGYGMPITVTLGSGAPQVIGLGVANAAIVQSYKIPRRKSSLSHKDFAQPMIYKINSDFTDAGAGTYTTTLVLEYGLIR